MVQLDQLVEGQQLPAHTKEKVTKVQLVKYAGASGDFNPLHTDDAFAQKIGLPGVIAHGMLVMGFLGEYVNKLAGDVAIVKDFKMRFGAMTVPNDIITCQGVVKKIYEEDGKQIAVLELFAEKGPQQIVGSGEAILQF
ncbi:MAG: MaoC/PaaZ C-terminal domain-containing protein [Solibacillus sp.]